MAESASQIGDRGEKLRHYTPIPSLAAVLIVAHRRPRVTVVERQGAGWRQRAGEAGELDRDA